MIKVPTFEQMKRFLIKHYKAERLYGRNGSSGWSGDYGDTVVKSHLADLIEYGIDTISRHESVNGHAIWIQFNRGAIREVDNAGAYRFLRRKIKLKG